MVAEEVTAGNSILGNFFHLTIAVGKMFWTCHTLIKKIKVENDEILVSHSNTKIN